MDARTYENYLAPTDQLAQEDIAAAAAVHRELGRDYDDAAGRAEPGRPGTPSGRSASRPAAASASPQLPAVTPVAVMISESGSTAMCPL